MNSNNDGTLKENQSNGKINNKVTNLTNKNHEIQKIRAGDNNSGVSSNKNMDTSNIYPVKPVPQRQTGSNLGFLLDAYRMSNPPKIIQNHSIDESLKKREDKALNKQLQQILSNNTNTLNNNNSSFSLGNMQDTLNAILNKNNSANAVPKGQNNFEILQQVSEGRKSSSEMEGNLKHRTPVKLKQHKSSV